MDSMIKYKPSAIDTIKNIYFSVTEKILLE